MLKKITLRVEFLGFFVYCYTMDNLKNFVVKHKYDLLCLLCLILMFFVNVLFAIPSIWFLIMGESKSED